jgi:hypothetical protein
MKNTDYESTIIFHPVNPHPSFFPHRPSFSSSQATSEFFSHRASFFIQSTHIRVFFSSTIIFHPVNPHRSIYFSSTTNFHPFNSNASIYFSSTKLFNQSTHIRTVFSSTIIFHLVNPHWSIYFSSITLFHRFNSNSTYFSSTILFIHSTHIQVVSLIHRHFSSSQPAFEYLFLIHMRVFISHPIKPPIMLVFTSQSTKLFHPVNYPYASIYFSSTWSNFASHNKRYLVRVPLFFPPFKWKCY